MTQHVRCICGKVFDPAGTPQCPACGAPAASATAHETPGSGMRNVALPPRNGGFSIGLALANLAALALAVVAAARFVVPDVVVKPPVIVDNNDKDNNGGHLRPNPWKDTDKDKEKNKEKKKDDEQKDKNNLGQNVEKPKPGPGNDKEKEKEVEKPKPPVKHEWIVDAKGGDDADGVDLAEVLEKAAPNDKVTVRPGIYPAAVVIAKPVKLIGDNKTKAKALIKAKGLKECISVTSKGVSIENLTFLMDGGGGAPAIGVVGSGELQITGCSIASKSALGFGGKDQAVITASKCTFSGIQGSAVGLDGTAQMSMDDCTFTQSASGVMVVNGAQATLKLCNFQDMGAANGGGVAFYASGEATTIAAERCEFKHCRTGMDILQKATVTLQDCTFAENGVADDPNALSMGLLKAREGGRVKIKGSTFRANKQGLVVMSGGNMELQDSHFTGNGMQASNPSLLFYCGNLVATGNGTIATVKHCDFSGALRDTIDLSNGASLTMTDTDISSGASDGLNIGLGPEPPPSVEPGAGIAPATNPPPCKVELSQCHFTGNDFGVAVGAGSSITVTGTTFVRQGTALLIQDSGTTAQLNQATVSESNDHALACLGGAQATAQDCTFEGNSRGILLGEPKTATLKSTLKLENGKLASNGEYDATVCPGQLLILRNCTYGPDGKGKPKLVKQKGGEIDAQPPVDTLADAGDGGGQKKTNPQPKPKPKPKPVDPLNNLINNFRKKYLPH